MIPIGDAVDLGLILLDENGLVSFFNAWARRHARIKSNPAGKSLQEVMTGRIDPRLIMAIREALDFGFSARLSHALHPMPLPLFPNNKHGQECRIRQAVDVTPIRQGNGKRSCMIQIRDVSEVFRREQLLRQQALQLSQDIKQLTIAQEELRNSEIRFRELAKKAPAGLFETDQHGRLTYLNEKCAELLQISTPDALGSVWLDALPVGEMERVSQRWEAALQSSTRFADEFRSSAQDDRLNWLRAEAGPIWNEDRSLRGFIGTISDITEFRERADRYEFRANHDSLTGLANRERFELRLRAALSGANEIGQKAAVIYFDLDYFKAVNDTHGHAAGDTVLRTIANRARRVMRGDDLIARLGGDEFAILLPEPPDEHHMAGILNKLQQAISMSINIGSAHVNVGCSAGYAIFPDHGRTVGELLAHADTAMYREKTRKKQNPKQARA